MPRGKVKILNSSHENGPVAIQESEPSLSQEDAAYLRQHDEMFRAALSSGSTAEEVRHGGDPFSRFRNSARTSDVATRYAEKLNEDIELTEQRNAGMEDVAGRPIAEGRPQAPNDIDRYELRGAVPTPMSINRWAYTNQGPRLPQFGQVDVNYENPESSTSWSGSQSGKLPALLVKCERPEIPGTIRDLEGTPLPYSVISTFEISADTRMVPGNDTKVLLAHTSLGVRIIAQATNSLSELEDLRDELTTIVVLAGK